MAISFMDLSDYPRLARINGPNDIKNLTTDEMSALCDEIRTFLLKSVSVTGGHLASNLGVVELTLALHYVFNSPNDKLLFDVGHQSYTHKLLTGRRDRFDMLRKKGGLSGFTRREESPHDAVSSGHASHSISLGLGLLEGMRQLDKSVERVICVVGDASISGGMAVEAMNHCGQLGRSLIIILNDNEMSIDTNVGALHNYLSMMTAAKPYQNIRVGIERFFAWLPGKSGVTLYNFGVRCKRALKGMFFNKTIFSDFGFEYAGPIDGHNIPLLIKTLKNAAEIHRPVVIHVVTQKGRGYHNALVDPGAYHGVSPFTISDGISPAKSASFSSTFGEAVKEEAALDKRVIAITAGMCEGTGLSLFKKAFPKRFFDVGIAEEHAVSFASGLALSGMKPVVAVYSTFMQRATDQVIHDVAMQGSHVVFAMDRAGVTPADGESHQGLFDIALFRSVPGAIFMAPATGAEVRLMLSWALKRTKPVFLRWPKAPLPEEEPACETSIELGKGVSVRKESGASTIIVTLGAILSEALDARDRILPKDIVCDVYNLRFIAPLDEEFLLRLFKPYKIIVFIEEGVKEGGLGEKIASICLSARNPPKFLHLAAPNKFLSQATRAEALKMCGLDAASIAKRVKSAYGEARLGAIASTL